WILFTTSAILRTDVHISRRSSFNAYQNLVDRRSRRAGVCASGISTGTASGVGILHGLVHARILGRWTPLGSSGTALRLTRRRRDRTPDRRSPQRRNRRLHHELVWTGG